MALSLKSSPNLCWDPITGQVGGSGPWFGGSDNGSWKSEDRSTSVRLIPSDGLKAWTVGTINISKKTHNAVSLIRVLFKLTPTRY